MRDMFAMRRANGDWFALDDAGRLRVPLFHSIAHAMVARSRDSGMECFRSVLLDQVAIDELRTTDGGSACFWLIDNPELRLSRGRALDVPQFIQLVFDQ